jgi:hypothetical protein
MHKTGPPGKPAGRVGAIPRRGLRLLRLTPACDKRGTTPRAYHANNDLLPPPIKQLGPTGRVSMLLFAEHEIDAMIEDLLAKREAEMAMVEPEDLEPSTEAEDQFLTKVDHAGQETEDGAPIAQLASSHTART